MTVPRALPEPQDLLPEAPLVWAALQTAGWSAAALDGLLGAGHRAHLDRDELAPLLRRTDGGTPLEVLARLFVLGTEVDLKQARRAGVPESWLVPDGFGVGAAVRLQPVVHDGVEVLVAHDPARASLRTQPQQVLGVGAASLTLAAATPRTRVGRALDLGTGSGVQALLAEDHCEAVVATDANPRAAAYSRLSAALSGREVEARVGDLLEPVSGDAYDLVVSNPPFIIGPGAGYVYRDAGLDGDDLCRRLVQELPSVLAPGGHAVLLANWLHVKGEDGDARVQAWFGPDVDGWVVQRELAAPEDYVTAWRLRDDVRLHQVARRTDEGWYADAQVLQQERGLRWSGGVDVYGATLLAGCDGTRRLGDLLAVLAGSAGISEADAAEQVLPVVERLVEQGFLVP